MVVCCLLVVFISFRLGLQSYTSVIYANLLKKNSSEEIIVNAVLERKMYLKEKEKHYFAVPHLNLLVILIM